MTEIKNGRLFATLKALLIWSMLLPPFSVAAGSPWYPVTVEVWQPPFEQDAQRNRREYRPLTTVEKNWKICAFIPHLKDPYWLGVNYGLIQEAERLGLDLRMYEADGYHNLDIQRRQIAHVLEEKDEKIDGLIISAISVNGLNDLAQELKRRNIPVVDLINGMPAELITARVAGSYFDNGFQTGRYLANLQKKRNQPLKIAWFPGPQGPGWVRDGDRGLREGITGSPIEIVATRYGDTGLYEQTSLLKVVLDQYGEQLDYIVGTTATAESAVRLLRKRKSNHRIGVLSYYYSPGVDRYIKRGEIIAAPTDHQVLQARLAVDTMARILEGKSYERHLAPPVQIIDGDSRGNWDSSTTLPPRGFRPVFNVDQ